MIDDIVELPRPLKKFRLGNQSSYVPYEAPVSKFGIQLGICVEIEDLPICIGNEFDLVAGKDAPFRYKMIEHTSDFIREYVTISDGPITSRESKIFTLWMNQYDRKTHLTERYYFWDLIEECRRHYGFQDCMRLDNEVQDLVSLLNPVEFPGLKRAYIDSVNKLRPIRDEVRDIDNMYMLRGNILALQEAIAGDCMFHPDDVLRGVDLEPKKGITLYSGAGRILSNNIVVPKDLKWMLGPDHVTKPYHMCLRSTRPPLPDANVHALVEYSNWFDVLKYVELIPYSEFTVDATDRVISKIRVFNPYDTENFKDIRFDQMDESISEPFTKLFEELAKVLPSFKTMTLHRSWGEEVYITLQLPDCKTKQYYFDLTYAALGSRMFTPTES